MASLWSGKEALAKALGDALRYDPRRLESPAGMARRSLWSLAGHTPDRDRRARRLGLLGGGRRGRDRAVTGARRRQLIAVAVLGVTCSVAACGDNQPGPRARPPAGLTPARRSSYRWLVATQGPAPTIAQENRARGTRGWRLAGPAAQIGGVATGTVRGYVAKPALLPGQQQSIDVSAPGSRTVTIRIYRMGWYGGSGGREVLAAPNLSCRAAAGRVVTAMSPA